MTMTTTISEENESHVITYGELLQKLFELSPEKLLQVAMFQAPDNETFFICDLKEDEDVLLITGE